MKKQDKCALIAVILVVVSRVATLFSKNLMGLIWGEEAARSLALVHSISAATSLLFIFLINIGISFWLYHEAKKTGKVPWVWCLFGLMFGLIGVSVFYLVRICELLEEKGGFSHSGITTNDTGEKE